MVNLTVQLACARPKGIGRPVEQTFFVSRAIQGLDPPKPLAPERDG